MDISHHKNENHREHVVHFFMRRHPGQKPGVVTPDASRVVPWVFDQLPWMHLG